MNKIRFKSIIQHYFWLLRSLYKGAQSLHRPCSVVSDITLFAPANTKKRVDLARAWIGHCLHCS